MHTITEMFVHSLPERPPVFFVRFLNRPSSIVRHMKRVGKFRFQPGAFGSPPSVFAALLLQPAPEHQSQRVHYYTPLNELHDIVQLFSNETEKNRGGIDRVDGQAVRTDIFEYRYFCIHEGRLGE